MTPEDIRLLGSAILGIALSILLIVKGRLHPFVGLLCGAFVVGIAAGLPIGEIVKAVQKGVGDILGGTGLVVALGLSLGAMLYLSNGAASIARVGLGFTGPRGAPWASLLVAMVIGLPLFFETGLVLLMPIIAAAAAGLGESGGQSGRLRLMLPAVAGLSVLHALVPPHPGPLLATATLGADLGRTILYGVLVAIPTAIVSGPLLARFLGRGIVTTPLAIEDAPVTTAPPLASSLIVILMPVLLISAGLYVQLLPAAIAAWLGGIGVTGNPDMSLLLINLLALALHFWRRL